MLAIKRVLAFLPVLIMLCLVLAGCGAGRQSAGQQAEDQPPAVEKAGQPVKEGSVEQLSPGIDLNAGGGVGRTVPRLERLEVLNRETGEILFATEYSFDSEGSGSNWTGKNFSTGNLPWRLAVIKAYLYLDGPAMLGPTAWRCKAVSWDIGRDVVGLFNAPPDHPRLNIPQ